jgi:hypothetical protein
VLVTPIGAVAIENVSHRSENWNPKSVAALGPECRGAQRCPLDSPRGTAFAGFPVAPACRDWEITGIRFVGTAGYYSRVQDIDGTQGQGRRAAGVGAA